MNTPLPVTVLLQLRDGPAEKRGLFCFQKGKGFCVSLGVSMFRVNGADTSALTGFENMLGAIGADAPKVINRAIARTGDMARTQVIKTLAVQTGLPQKIIRRSLKVTRPSKGYPLYVIHSAGGDVSLKYFRRRETTDGVEAYLGSARGKEVFLGDTFFKGGAFPGRRVEIRYRQMGGHVYGRVGGRTQLQRINSGVFIPAEMVDGASALAFEQTVERVLPRRLNHEVGRILGA